MQFELDVPCCRGHVNMMSQLDVGAHQWFSQIQNVILVAGLSN